MQRELGKSGFLFFLQETGLHNAEGIEGGQRKLASSRTKVLLVWPGEIHRLACDNPRVMGRLAHKRGTANMHLSLGGRRRNRDALQRGLEQERYALLVIVFLDLLLGKWGKIPGIDRSACSQTQPSFLRETNCSWHPF